MKKRLDQLVVERGLATSRDAAKRLILAGRVSVEGQRRDKAGKLYDESLDVQLAVPSNPYVSRGGLKLEHALETFGVRLDPEDIVLDIGASTGGFTDCMLQKGAGKVLAVDVGRAQLHEKLRRDPRVVVMERTNARSLSLEDLGGVRVPWIVIDVSFISLRLILPACRQVLRPGGRVIALVKPQFEAGRADVGSGGIVRDEAVHRRVLEGLLEYGAQEGWVVDGLTVSPLLGNDGNTEFFMFLRREETGTGGVALGKDAVASALAEAEELRSKQRSDRGD